MSIPPGTEPGVPKLDRFRMRPGAAYRLVPLEALPIPAFPENPDWRDILSLAVA